MSILKNTFKIIEINAKDIENAYIDAMSSFIRTAPKGKNSKQEFDDFLDDAINKKFNNYGIWEKINSKK